MTSRYMLRDGRIWNRRGFSDWPKTKHPMRSERRVAKLPIRHFLRHVKKELAILFCRFGQQATKLVEITSLFTDVSPSYVVRRCALQVDGQSWRVFALVEELIEGDLKGTRKLFQCLNGRDRVAIFYPGNITTKQPSSLFDVALGEFLFLPHFAEAVANNHGALLHQRMARASAHTQPGTRAKIEVCATTTREPRPRRKYHDQF